MRQFSARTRAANLTRMAEEPFDVLVIGGGITGAGIALDAAARGASVALVEKDDFASGTSGRSSRLVHGGLRYLEHGEFGLVRESLRERGILYRLAPHLVRPVPMYMLAGDWRRQATYRAGLTAYEMLAAPVGVQHVQRDGAYQVRRQPEQDAPFPQRLADQAELSVLQVAQAAVHQPGRAARGAGREVVLLHQGHGQPARRGVQGDAGPGDPAADHQHVERVLGHPGQAGRAGLRGERQHQPIITSTEGFLKYLFVTGRPRKTQIARCSCITENTRTH